MVGCVFNLTLGLNCVLQQLLSDERKLPDGQIPQPTLAEGEDAGVVEGEQKRSTSELLQKLLQEEEEEENCTSAPAVSENRVRLFV